MKKKRKKGSGLIAALIPVVFIGVALVWWRTNGDIGKNATVRNLEYIIKHTNSAGNIVDYTGDIGVKSIADIKLYVTSREIRIEYGKILLTFKGEEEFLSEEYTGLLEKVGITREINKKTGLLEVFYHGVKLERWAT